MPSMGDYQSFSGEDVYHSPPATPPHTNHSSSPPKTDDQAARDAFLVAHAPPGPCYAGLMNNVSLINMRTSLQDWRLGLDDFVNQSYLEEYVQSTARRCGVDPLTRYNTRVDRITKTGRQWKVFVTTANESSGNLRLASGTSLFDAVVVASGHYNTPRVPNLPGLRDWKSAFPDRISHSIVCRVGGEDI